MWLQKEPSEADPSSGNCSGNPKIPSRDLGRRGAASPAPFFQISRFAPRPSLPSAHSSAGGAASSPKLSSISSSSSSSCSIPGVDCRRIKPRESRAKLKIKGAPVREAPRACADAPRSQVTCAARPSLARRVALGAPHLGDASAHRAFAPSLLGLENRSLHNLAQTKCSGHLSRPGNPCPTHALILNKTICSCPNPDLWNFTFSLKTSSPLSGKLIEKIEAVRIFLQNLIYRTAHICTCFIISFHFFQQWTKRSSCQWAISIFVLGIPGSLAFSKALLLHLFPHFLVSSIWPLLVDCSQVSNVAQCLPPLKDVILVKIIPSLS